MLKKNYKINNEIYEDEYILKTIEDFEWFSISYKKSELEINGESGEEIDKIFNEFMNYCLALRNELL